MSIMLSLKCTQRVIKNSDPKPSSGRPIAISKSVPNFAYLKLEAILKKIGKFGKVSIRLFMWFHLQLPISLISSRINKGYLSINLKTL